MYVNRDEGKTSNAKLQLILRFDLDPFSRCENQYALIDN